MGKTKILIVEDEGIVAEDIKRSMKDLGYDVSGVVSSGEEAIEKVEKKKPNLVLMDIVLQGKMGGIEAADQIRSRFDVPVVYLTAYADVKTLERAKITEPFGYIIKPFEVRDLHVTVEMALRKHEIETRLKESEEWLSTTLRSIGDAVIATDADGLVTFMNPIAQFLTGWNEKKAVGKPLKDVFNIINEKTGAPSKNPVGLVLKEGVIVGLANHTILIGKDGKKIPIDDSAAPIKDELGNIIGVVLIFRDITERKKAEELLQDSEAKFRNIVQSSPMGMHIYQLEKDGRLVFIGANPAADKILGVDNSKFIGKTIEEAFPPLSETEVPERYRQTAAEGIPWYNEQIDYKYGQISGVFEVHAFQIPPGKMAAMFIDITERKKAEEERLLPQKINNMLNAGVSQEEVFKTIVDSIRSLYDYDSVAIHILSKDKKHMIVRGYSADSKVAKKLEDLTGLTIMGYKIPLPKDSLFKKVFDSGKPVITNDIAWVLKSYAGRKSLYGMTKIGAKLTKAKWGIGVPLLAGDKFVGVIGCGSREKLTDEDAERFANFGAQAGLAIDKARTYDKLASTNVELKKSNQTKDLFIDIMTHDLLNPVGAMRGLVELAIEDEENLNKKEIFRRVYHNSERLIDMIENASIIAKLESGEEQEIEKRDLGGILRNAAREMTHLADEKNMKIKTPERKGEFVTLANPLIYSVFLNLMSNAVKYGPENSEIVAKIEDDGPNWKVSIADNGPGIADDDKEAVFGRFKRRMKESVEGTGLGLAIVKRIVELHNGKVWVEDNPGGGSIFFVRLKKA